MKRILLGCLLLLAGLILQPTSAMATDITGITGSVQLVISGILASGDTASSASISWLTNGNSTSQVFYDIEAHANIGDYTNNVVDANLVSHHTMTLTGLSPNTTYHCKVKSVLTVDGINIIAISDDFTFTTLATAGGPGGGGPGGGGGGGGGGGALPPSGFTGNLNVNVNGYTYSNGSLTTLDGKLKLDIDIYTRLLNQNLSPVFSLSVSPTDSTLQAPSGNTILMKYNLGPNGTTFNPSIKLTFSYGDVSLPQGASDSDLQIGWWDGTSWQGLRSEVDTTAKTVTTNVTHFTHFALLSTVPAPVITPPKIIASTQITTTIATPRMPTTSSRLQKPAAFIASNLSVSPTAVNIGQTVTIKVLVTNTGEVSGTHSEILNIDGLVTEIREVKLDAGTAELVIFKTSPKIPKKYTVAIDNLSEVFFVNANELPSVSEAPPNKLLSPLVIISTSLAAGTVICFILLVVKLLKNRKNDYP